MQSVFLKQLSTAIVCSHRAANSISHILHEMRVLPYRAYMHES